MRVETFYPGLAWNPSSFFIPGTCWFGMSPDTGWLGWLPAEELGVVRQGVMSEY
jgi:hypothetical protein